MDNESKKISRRLFLGAGATGGMSLALAALMPTPVEKLVEAMTGGFISRAFAEEMGNAGSRNYVHLLLAGAPHRYVFDHWMKTSATETMDFNPIVATAVVGSGGVAAGTQYLTIPYKGLMVPKMFEHQVTSGTGGKRALTELLDNMLVIRGYGTGMDGHPFNATLQMAPLGGASSLAGLAADYSNKTFQAIQWPDRITYGNYNSVMGKALNKLAGGRPINNLLEGFASPGADRMKARSLKVRNQEAIDLAQARMKAYINTGLPGSRVLASNLSGASDLMKKGVGNIDGFWTEALARYQRLINASMRETNLSGLSDVVLSGTGIMNRLSAYGGEFFSINDLRAMMGTRTLPAQLAEGFALTEYVLQEGLGTSIELTTTDMGSMQVMDTMGGSASHTFHHDMHEMGAIPGLLITSSYYRGISAAILELKSKLRAINVNGTDGWSESVVQITSDFGRAPRTDGSGSDHGFNGMVTSVYSGVIQAPSVVGNILKSGQGGNYSGTQGLGAEIDGYNQKGRPTPVMAASTVASLLRVNKNPFENVAAPLVQVTGGKMVSLSKGKIVG